jgi:hypothetical protein
MDLIVISLKIALALSNNHSLTIYVLPLQIRLSIVDDLYPINLFNAAIFIYLSQAMAGFSTPWWVFFTESVRGQLLILVELLTITV